MKKQKAFKLIDGTFSSKDSRELLQGLLTYKIQFHEMKNFSSLERKGKEDKTSLKKMAQLKKSRDKISKLIQSAEKKGDWLEIKSEIVLRLVVPE